MIVVIRIRGQVDVNEKIKAMLNSFHLKKKFSCILIKDNEKHILGKINEYVAYGQFDDKLIEKLKKRNKGKYYALMPPRGGLKRSSKLLWPRGVLGDNKDINKLLERML